MEKLVNKTYEICEKVYHLEKILAKKKDPVSHTCFLESFSENGRSIILNNFWKMATEMLADGISKAAQGMMIKRFHQFFLDVCFTLGSDYMRWAGFARDK